MGYEVSYMPMKYLDLPLGAKFKAKIIRNTILEKMERRQAGRKQLYLLERSLDYLNQKHSFKLTH